jgi:hypothetical protein
MSGDHTKYHGTAEVVKDKGEEHMKAMYIHCVYINSRRGNWLLRRTCLD